MPRVPGSTRKGSGHPGGWTLVQNPGFPSTPRIMLAKCHDETPFLTIQCSSCRTLGHLHESQFDDVPEGTTIATRCKGCSRQLEFPIAFIRGAFQRMRDEGWIE